MTDVDSHEVLLRELDRQRSALQELANSLRLVNLQLDVLGKVTRDLRNKIMDEPEELYRSHKENEGLEKAVAETGLGPEWWSHCRPVEVGSLPPLPR